MAARAQAMYNSMMATPRGRLALVACALVVTQFMLACLSVVAKIALARVHWLVFAFCREVIAGPMLAAIGYAVEGARPQWRDAGWLVLLGATGVWGNQFFVFIGLHLTSPIQVAIMQPTTPVFAAAIAIAFKLEPPGLWKLGGIACAFIGAVVMVGVEGFSLSNERTIGTLCLVVNCGCTAVYLVLQKPLLARYPPISLTGWAYCIGSVMMGTCLAGYNIFIETTPGLLHPPTEFWLPLLYSVFFATVLAYFFITWANKHSSPSAVAASWTMQPMFSAAVSYLVLGTVILLRQVFGAALILAGLGLVVYDKYQDAEVTVARAQAEATQGGDTQTPASPVQASVEMQPLMDAQSGVATSSAAEKNGKLAEGDSDERAAQNSDRQPLTLS